MSFLEVCADIALGPYCENQESSKAELDRAISVLHFLCLTLTEMSMDPSARVHGAINDHSHEVRWQHLSSLHLQKIVLLE